MLKLVPTKIDKLYPKVKLIEVTWNWYWFRDIRSGFYSFYLHVRGANYRTIWLGPIQIDLRAKWLIYEALS